MVAIITAVQLSPLYDGPPVLTIEGLGDPSDAFQRQRERLRDALGSLNDEQWRAQSRCEKWSVKDVVSHLSVTDSFWTISFAAALKGEPTRFLATFDPVTTPEQLVDGTRSQTNEEVFAEYERNVESLIALTASITDWSAPAEAPPGHLPLNVTALHALWDSWVHERDILLPLGLVPAEEPDELDLILRYVAALSPALDASRGQGRRGTLSVEATDPPVAVTVEVGERVVVRPGVSAGPRLSGRAVDLVEGLSYRGPLPSDLAEEDRWLLVGLAEVFDVA